MGMELWPVCHDCKVRCDMATVDEHWGYCGAKETEICLPCNEQLAADIGRFFARHAGHRIDWALENDDTALNYLFETQIV